jgi:hypothetical protein
MIGALAMIIVAAGLEEAINRLSHRAEFAGDHLAASGRRRKRPNAPKGPRGRLDHFIDARIDGGVNKHRRGRRQRQIGQGDRARVDADPALPNQKIAQFAHPVMVWTTRNVGREWLAF